MKKVFCLILIVLFVLPALKINAESDLNVNNGANYLLDAVYNTSSENANPPQVDLFFAPQNPTSGEEATAIAGQMNFDSDASKLYFTWFLKRTNCPENKSDCDLNKDGDVDIEDYKIEAMRALASRGFDWENESYEDDTDDDGYRAKLGGDDRSGLTKCYIHDFSNNLDFRLNSCEHLFPDEDIAGEKIGDGSFSLGEEEFWHTNPNSTNTISTNNVDEANIAGLGASTFKWDYRSGDKVGVVVEGTSAETDRVMWAMPKNKCSLKDFLKVDLDSSEVDSNTTTKTGTLYGMPFISKTTIAESTEIGDYNGEAATYKTILETETVTSINPDDQSAFIATTVYKTVTVTYVGWLSITTTQTIQARAATSYTSEKKENIFTMEASDINDCLADNMVSPIEKDAGKNLDVSLSYSPENPYNDPTGSNSLELKISASVLGADNPDLLNYAWKVYAGDNKDAVDWKDPIVKSRLLDSSQANGMGIGDFKFKIAFNNPTPKYLKVKVNVSESAAKNTVNQGFSEVVIPIPAITSTLKVFSTSVNPDSAENALRFSEERCQDEIGKIVCPVVQNEIIGFRASSDNLTDFVWSVDGEPLTYEKCFFQNCDSNQNNFAYFPVLKSLGETYNVEVAAVDKKTGEAIRLNRIFQVAEPSILITSEDKQTCQPTLLGYFRDLDDNLWPDYSPDTFEATPKSILKLKPNFNMPLTGAVIWNIDGQKITRSNAAQYNADIAADGTISFPLNKESGESLSVSVSSFYTQPNEIKKLLNQYWDVDINDFYEKTINATIEINVVDILTDGQTDPDLSQNNSRNKFLATLVTGIPKQMLFLLKLAIASLLILFGSHLLLSFFSKQIHA